MANGVTIMDVAKRVGVSKSTVSHALNPRRSTSPITRKKVLDAANLLGYKPNYAAQCLSKSKTMMVGVLIDDLRDLHNASLVECFSDELVNASYEMLLGIIQNRRELAIDYLARFSTGMVDGIINLLPALTADEARTIARGVPTVTYLRRGPECPTYLDYVPGTMEAIGHLWGLGHRRIGFLAEPESAKDASEDGRVVGYRQFFALRQTSMDADMLLFTEPRNNDIYGIQEKIQLLYDRGATAIFTSLDSRALIALQWAHRKGLRVPEDLSVIGFNDSRDAAASVPALTTVQVPVRSIVAATVGALIAAMENRRTSQQQVIVPHLIIRESTAKPKER